MNRTNKSSFVLLGLCVLMLFSCQKAPKLTITSPSSIEFSVDGSSGTITFTANRDWSASVSDSWVSVSPSSGTASDGPVSITVRCNANTTYDDRTSTVIIRMEELSQTIIVMQAGRIAVASVELDQANLSIKPGETVALVATVKPDNASDKSVTWISSDTAIITVDETGKVTAVAEGSATITAKAGERTAISSATVYIPEGAVDLGIEMTREDGSIYRLFWAKCNIGASKPVDKGDYYAWGETETKLNYSWDSYTLANGAENKLTKYCPTDKTDYWNGSGSPDGKTVLDPEDDVAHVKLGGKWRIPTDAEWRELQTNCTWIWTTQNGIKGSLVSSKKNGNSIFLPAAGFRYDNSRDCNGVLGHYWSSSLLKSSPYHSYALDSFVRDDGMNLVDFPGSNRYLGLSIRPVTE